MGTLCLYRPDGTTFRWDVFVHKVSLPDAVRDKAEAYASSSRSLNPNGLHLNKQQENILMLHTLKKRRLTKWNMKVSGEDDERTWTVMQYPQQ